jgi:hypothetical protein
MRHLVIPSRAARAGPTVTMGSLRCRVRLPDGRVFDGPLAAERHRAIHLGMLHADTDGLVELTPGTRSEDGALAVDRRARPEHYLPGGARGDPAWLAKLLAHAERIVTGTYARSPRAFPPREEAFVGPAARTRPRGSKDAVGTTRFLWIDVDRPDRLEQLWTFLAERPCHLLIQSGGSGGVHAYWKLDRPLGASAEEPQGGGAIERAHLRIIHALGADRDGRPDVADPRCADRSRVMRLAGTVNHKRDAWARVLEADLALAPYRVEDLVGDLGDPASAVNRPGQRPDDAPDDPYKQMAPPEYFQRLAGITVPRHGLVRCPVPGHDDTHPSCSVGRDPTAGWCCHSSSCGARGAIYDLASVLIGGPWGSKLRGESFARARAHVVATFGTVDPNPDHQAANAQPIPARAPKPDGAGERLWTIRVSDDVDPRIAGHSGCSYSSPPQPRADALALVALLVGRPVEAANSERWTHPIAGGQRTVSLESAPRPA